MELNKEQEAILKSVFRKKLEDQNYQGLLAGAKGILGAVLDMCNEGKSVEDIKNFCETSLDMKEFK